MHTAAAAANLCNWVINIYTFNRIYVRVKPLMDALVRKYGPAPAAADACDDADTYEDPPG